MCCSCAASCASGLARWRGGASAPPAAEASELNHRAPEPVVLHVYDMGDDDVARKVNEVFRPVGIGAFHGAVEVYGREWSYGYTEEGTGVFSGPPRGCPLHAYRESVSLGDTSLSKREVARLLRQLEWPGEDYDILRHNCCHWCDEFCRRLGAGAIPAWVNQLAGAGASLDDGVREAAAKAQAAIERARTKTRELNDQIRGTVEAKADEFRENVEATARDFLIRAERLDKTLGLSAAAEDVARRTQAALEAVRHSHTAAAAAGSGSAEAPLLGALPRAQLRSFGSETPTPGSHEKPPAARKKSF